MSGGVDSAVALLAAGANAVGVTLRLWIDPARARRRARLLLAGGGDRGARAPATRAGCRTSRSTCARSSAARSSSRSCAATRAARRRTRASAATAASASTSCSPSPTASAPRGSRPATTRASSSATGAARRPRRRRAQGPELHARHRSTRAALGRLWFPLGDQTKEETRAQAAAAGLARRRPRREPGGVLPRRRRLPRLPRAARARPRPRAASSTRAGRELGSHDGFWRFTPGQRRGLGVAAAEPLYALDHRRAATNTVVVGPRASLARTRVSVRGRLDGPDDPGRGEAPLPLARGRGDRRPRQPAASSCASTSPPSASRPGRPPSSTRTTPSSAPASSRPRPPTKIGRDARLDVRGRCPLPARVLPARRRARARLGAAPARDDLRRSSSFIRGTERELLPVIHKVGDSVDRVNGQLDKLDVATDSAVDAVDAVDQAVRTVSLGDPAAGREADRARRAALARMGDVAHAARLASGGQERQGGLGAARSRSRRRAHRECMSDRSDHAHPSARARVPQRRASRRSAGSRSGST